jgi:citrate synthase
MTFSPLDAPSSSPFNVPAGLSGVVVADTAIGDVRGDEGFFHYRHYDACDVARACSFEEAWHLVSVGHLPDPDELASFRASIEPFRAVPDTLRPLIAAVASTGGTPLTQLRSVLSVAAGPLGIAPLLDLPPADRQAQARRLAALVPSILAGLHRASSAGPAVVPEPGVGHVAAYLHAATGIVPPEAATRALEQYMILTIDHGFNASTFTGRVVASTGADLVDVVCAAIGALSGPLHGGAPGRALDALDAIGEPSRAADYVRGEIAAGRRIMGFGHAVYRTRDPRSALLRNVAEGLGGELVERAIAVEAEILATLAELKPDRPLPSNVEYYAGVVMATVGLPRSMFTPTFAVSRSVGWCTHAVEEAEAGKIIRPSSRYVGPEVVRPR